MIPISKNVNSICKFYVQSMEALHSNLQLSLNNQYVSLSVLSWKGNKLLEVVDILGHLLQSVLIAVTH